MTSKNIHNIYKENNIKLIKNNNIIIDSKSGLTGAGRELSISSHFTEVNENITAYKIGKHRHTPEIEQNLSESCKEKVSVVFTPNLIPVNRGILNLVLFLEYV